VVQKKRAKKTGFPFHGHYGMESLETAGLPKRTLPFKTALGHRLSP